MFLDSLPNLIDRYGENGLKVEEVVVHIGFDDTDSYKGGCTTYLASLVVEKIIKLGARFIDYPNLVRLNPNIPWKTRGNGALCLRFKLEIKMLNEVIKCSIETLKRASYIEDPLTHPAMAVLIGWPTIELKRLALKALTNIVKIEEALKMAEKERVGLYYFKEPQGVIGALAAIGETLEGDHTYELIAYRYVKGLKGERKVDKKSILEMDRQTRPLTFNNLDLETHRILITPRGPDPVLYGIRGESPQIVLKASTMVKVGEPIERWTIFRTNEGTDAHLKPTTIYKAQEYQPVIIRGKVVSKPKTIAGGHVIFKLTDTTGTIDCAAYEPTGGFRKIALALEPGDEIIVYGGIRPLNQNIPKTINLEKLLIAKLIQQYILINPKCKKCSTTLKSMGRGKGYRCHKCGERYPNAEKIQIIKPRILTKALYIPPPRAQRHLTKPYTRYTREKITYSYPTQTLDPQEFLWINPSIKSIKPL